jgi:uncharacterized protein YktA (UPF0223 family)
MQQINVYQFYQLAMAMHPITELKPGEPLKSYFFPLAVARFWITSLANDEVIPMTICKPVARRIVAAIDHIFPSKPEEHPKVDLEKEATASDLYYVIEGAKEFETIFSAELQNMATYFVSKKAIYDTNELIQRADHLFSFPIRTRLSAQVRLDLTECGKCLAFDLATASEFHIARAVEGVLLDYLQEVAPAELKKLNDSDRNLGRYIKIVKEKSGEQKIVSAFEQFKDLHRNPLMHPEAVLEVDDALTLLGIAQSAITAMVLDTIKRTTPSSVGAGLLGLAGQP